MISGGQLKRTGTTDEPAPTEVYPAMFPYVHAPDPKDLGKAASSVMATNLPPVRMPAQQQIKSGMRGLPVNFRRVRQKDREFFVRDRVGGFFDIVHRTPCAGGCSSTRSCISI